MANDSPAPRARKILRPEAAPLPWSDLDDGQQKAFERLLDFIAAAVHDLDSARQPQRGESTGYVRPPDWLDHYRDNRTVLLDGVRGIGKTSVLLSVINACTRGDPSLVPPPPELSKDTGGTEDKVAEIKENLNDIRCRVLWLEPLDMEPLPGPTNLLAAVLARIENLARSFVFPDTKNASERRGPVGILESCPDSLGALQEFLRLQSDVALAWDGNLPARGAHLDPDSYAVEVLRAEGARLSLNRNLRSALDALADTVFRGCGIRNPLFVLPVDDVDLYPARCLDILRLLRMIMVPRLLTIVLGSLDLIEIVLNLKYSGEFIALANADTPHDLISIQPERVRSRAGSVSANAMRKLLPPAQRIQIERMDIFETLNYRPASTPGQVLPRLHELLAKCPVDLPTIGGRTLAVLDGRPIENLRDFLLFPAPESIPDGRLTQDGLRRCCYSALTILQMVPRHAADSWLTLEELVRRFEVASMTRSEKQHALLYTLGVYCRSAINEDDTVLADDRQKYHESLRWNTVTRCWETHEPLTLYPDSGPLTPIDMSDAQRKREMFFRSSQDWRLYPGKFVPHAVAKDYDTLYAEIQQMRRLKPFASGTAQAFRVLHDLLALGPRWELMQRRITLGRSYEEWAVTVWSVTYKKAVYIPWPTPKFLSSWGYDIFLSYWNKAVYRLEKGEIEGAKAVRYCIFIWIDAAAATLLQKHTILGDETIPNTLDWRPLVERVTELLDINDVRRWLIEEWLNRLAYFLMPEICGVLVEETEKAPGSAVTQQSLLEFFYKEQQKLCDFWARRVIGIGQYVTEIKDTLSKDNVGMSKVGTEFETAWNAHRGKIEEQRSP